MANEEAHGRAHAGGGCRRRSPGSGGSGRVGEAGEERHDHARRLGHRARLRQDRCGRRVRPDLRAGRGRLQPRRDELHQFDGAARGGRGREGDLSRSPDEALHQSGLDAGEVRGEPRVAAEALRRVGRRPQLLPVQASRGEAARHQAVRAVDGAHVQRGEHRRRHRKRESRPARGDVRRRRIAGRPRIVSGRRRGSVPGAVGFERDRDRAVQHAEPPRAAADQPAHVVLLPVGSAGDERRGTQRIRRA